MDVFIIQKPCGEILAYTREKKAQRVASLYNTTYTKNPPQEILDKATWMEFR